MKTTYIKASATALLIIFGMIFLPFSSLYSSSQESLKNLHKIVFEKPEFTGNFMHGRNIPTPDFACYPYETIEKQLNDYYQHVRSHASFSDQSKWLGAPVNFKGDDRFVQKLTVSDGATICFMGDFHGSMHSLMRNILRLQALGHLDDTLTIKDKNFYMVFLGDYVDRGRWGVEVVSILTRLKIANWDNVYLLAGNHESMHISALHGLHDEAINKYGTEQGSKVFQLINTNFFKTLPVGLFIQCKNTRIQCCHGGIATAYNPKNFLDKSNVLFQNVGNDDDCRGLFWSDFCAGNQRKLTGARGYRIEEDKVITADQEYTHAYLKKNNLKAIIRAHQDQFFGVKIFHNADNVRNKKPVHWIKVAEKHGITNNHFPIHTFDYYPVFTFSSAVEARDFPYDCFGLVTTGSLWNNWNMEIYEVFLGQNNLKESRRGKYVHIHSDRSQAKTELVFPGDNKGIDPIALSWESFPQHSKEHSPSYNINPHKELSLTAAAALAGLFALNYNKKQARDSENIDENYSPFNEAITETKNQLASPFRWIKKSFTEGTVQEKLAATALTYCLIEASSYLLSKQLLTTHLYRKITAA